MKRVLSVGRRCFYGTGQICDSRLSGSLKAQPRTEYVSSLLLYSVAETKLQAKEDAGEKGTEPVRVRFCFNKVMHRKRRFHWEDALFMEQAKFVTAILWAV